MTYKEARRHHLLGNYEEALNGYMSVIEESPDTEEASYSSAQLKNLEADRESGLLDKFRSKNKGKKYFGGGLKGFLTGEQSLVATFLAGIGVALILLLVSQSIDVNRNFLLNSTLMLITSVTTRLVSWYAIYKCRNNTNSVLLQVIVGIAVVIDMFMQLQAWLIGALILLSL